MTGTAAILVALLIADALPAQAQEAITAAREAYGNAEYDRCVAVLDSAGTPDAKGIVAAEYRALCLLGMAKERDAEAAVEGLLRVDPLYQVAAGASPRLKALVTRVKRATLPAMLQDQYAAAKKAYEGKSYDVASTRFRTVMALLEDPAIDPADVATLGDMKTVAGAFLDLMAASPPAAPVETSATAAAPEIFVGGEKGLIPPQTIDQTLPPWRADAVFTRTGLALRGTLEIVIDESGAVESVKASRIHPHYDVALQRAVRTWRYVPAKVNGSPVKFRKTIEISLKPS